MARADGVSLSRRRRRRARGRSPAACAAVRCRQTKSRAAQRPGGVLRLAGGALSEWIARLSCGSEILGDTSPASGDSSFLAKRGAQTHLEVSDGPNQAHTHYRDVPIRASARDCARSCSLGRTRHLCKLLLYKLVVRAARRTLGPDPSRTPPVRTTLVVRAAAKLGTDPSPARPPQTHTKPSPIPAPPQTAHPIHSVGEGL